LLGNKNFKKKFDTVLGHKKNPAEAGLEFCGVGSTSVLFWAVVTFAATRMVWVDCLKRPANHYVDDFLGFPQPYLFGRQFYLWTQYPPKGALWFEVEFVHQIDVPNSEFFVDIIF